jgi:hypothetical protein
MSNRASRRRNKSKPDSLSNVPDSEIGEYIFDKKRLTTPVEIDNNVQQFCKKISPKELPVFLAVQSPNWSRLKYCNKNVEHMIQLYGGKMVLGYKIWYVPMLYIEAETHAVWQNPGGQLIDITFNPDGETRVLFLPTPKLKTVIAQSYKKPRIAFHPRIKSFIEIKEKMEKLEAPFIRHTDTWDGWEKELSFETWSLEKQKAG